MITREDLAPIGRLLKPHGINGEITMLLTADVDVSGLRCILLNLDGIFVPFFPTAVRPKSSETDLISIDGVTDEDMAGALCPKDVYALRSDLGTEDNIDADGLYASDLIGFTIISDGNAIGSIRDVDDSTENFLFVVEGPGGAEILIPVVNDWIQQIDSENRNITMTVPPELLSNL